MARLWTDAERTQAQALRREGKPWVEVGAVFGASKDSVRHAVLYGRPLAPEGCGSERAPIAPTEPEPSGVVHHSTVLDPLAGSTKAVQAAVNRQVEGSSPSSPAIHTSKSRAESYLLISDLQIPYHHPGALDFCKRVRIEFGIPLENVICVGDEFDLYWQSRFEKASSAPHTANQEVEAGRTEIARWVAAFPFLRICESNHVKGRMNGAASRGGLGDAFVRTVREVYNLPETWSWADHWIIRASKAPFRVEHGHVGPGGHSGLRGRPLNRMISTAWGHEHAEAGIIHLNTHGGGKVWGMRTGSLLTTEPVPAFSYNEGQGSRPVGSVGVVLDGGRLPLIVRM